MKMIIILCDRCGKQVKRYTGNDKYEIWKSKTVFGQPEETISCGTNRLTFCKDCYAAIEKILDRELESIPERVEVELCKK